MWRLLPVLEHTDFYNTRAGRTYYDKTLPELVEQFRRLAAAVERLAAQRDQDGP
jgi:hypothetical protein